LPLGIGAIFPRVAAADSPTLNRIKATGTITFGYRDNAVPFSYKDRDGRIRGYSVELCMRVAGSIQNELGLTALKIEWLPVEASNRLDYVISGKVDAVCGTTTITLGRMQKVDFSLPIYVDGGSMLVRASRSSSACPTSRANASP
jgi:ABC-type amino acid transport substrate-binding protein